MKIGEALLKTVTNRKLTGLSSSTTKARMTIDARTRLNEAESLLENYQEGLKTLQEEFSDQVAILQQKWNDIQSDISEISLSPTKQNIRISHFGILWKG